MDITKSIMVSVVGRANTGKSTLLNSLVGRKIAITSPKPQTTRNRITGVVERDGCQFVFMDTPGLHKPKSKLGEYMVDIVTDTIADVEAVVLVVEPTTLIRDTELDIINKIKSLSLPAVLAVNKIDTVKKEGLFEVIDAYRKLHEFSAVVPICAKTGEGCGFLLDELAEFAMESGRLFPEGMLTDQSEGQISSEIIREKMLNFLSAEIPHGTAVEIERFSRRDNGVLDISAVIYCEKQSHKGIIIGKGGAMLKKIGGAARFELERFFGSKVFLETFVKVKENWRDRVGFMKNMGFDKD